MNENEILEQIEKLKLQLDDIKDQQDRAEEVIEINETKEVVSEDFQNDDPKGDLADSNRAILSELAGLRASLENILETQSRQSDCLRKQGYKL